MSKQDKLKDLTGPLSVITWCCSVIESTITQLRSGGVVCTPVPTVANEELEALKLYWGLPNIDSLDIYEALLPKEKIKMRLVSHGIDIDRGSEHIGVKSLECEQEHAEQLFIKPIGKSETTETHTAISSFEGVEELLHIASDQYIEEVDFYTKVLGKEAQLVNDDIIINSSTSAYSAIRLERLEEEGYEEEVVSRFPSTGWVMSSYETSDLGEILARAHASQNKVYRTPRKLVDPVLGSILCMSLLSPSGMVVEVYQNVKG